jgi:hypothetical protein
MEVDFLGSLRSEVDVRIATVPICTVCDLIGRDAKSERKKLCYVLCCSLLLTK